MIVSTWDDLPYQIIVGHPAGIILDSPASFSRKFVFFLCWHAARVSQQGVFDILFFNLLDYFIDLLYICHCLQILLNEVGY